MACLVMTIARLRVLKHEEKMRSVVNTIIVLILIIMDTVLKIKNWEASYFLSLNGLQTIGPLFLDVAINNIYKIRFLSGLSFSASKYFKPPRASNQ